MTPSRFATIKCGDFTTYYTVDPKHGLLAPKLSLGDPVPNRSCHLYHPRIVHLCNVKEVAPSKRLNFKSLIYNLYLFLSLFHNNHMLILCSPSKGCKSQTGASLLTPLLTSSFCASSHEWDCCGFAAPNSPSKSYKLYKGEPSSSTKYDLRGFVCRLIMSPSSFSLLLGSACSSKYMFSLS